MKYNEDDYNELLKLLLTHPNRNYTGEFLKNRFILTTQKLQLIIHDMRVNGIPIISNGNYGYKYSTKTKEIVKCYMSLNFRAKSIGEAATGLLNFIQKDCEDDLGD